MNESLDQRIKISNNQIPLIIVDNFYVPSILEKKEIEKIIFTEKEKFDKFRDSKKDYNFALTQDYNSFLGNLYKNFFSLCEKLFGDLKVSSNNNNTVWSFCSNEDYFLDFWHDHITTCTISGVYYFSMPDLKNGFIEFLQDDKTFKFYPEENQLIIFPNFLSHKPNKIKTKDYRIAMNMEILSNFSSTQLFSKVFSKKRITKKTRTSIINGTEFVDTVEYPIN